jgi:dihydroorotate dehydrogenase
MPPARGPRGVSTIAADMPLVPFALARPLLFAMDPESAHERTLGLLARIQGTPLLKAFAEERVDDPVTVAGLRFPNRIGLAAGLDKNARCIDALGAMGFGFVEVGTVTPKPQPGNPKPRMFRLTAADALVNRLGFNNDGLAAFVANVRRSRFRQRGGILGLNIGKNAATPIERAADDYLACLEGVYPHADYVTVNVSSPNTKGLRDLQGEAMLDALLSALRERRDALAARDGRRVPLFLKIAPDLDSAAIDAIAATLLRHAIDGVVATNTTLSREGVAHLPHAGEAGGLSGRPLLGPSNRVVSRLRDALGPAFPIVGVGGVMAGEDAASKLAAGADLVQVYTGFVYAGPALIPEAARAMARHPRPARPSAPAASRPA